MRPETKAPVPTPCLLSCAPSGKSLHPSDLVFISKMGPVAPTLQDWPRTNQDCSGQGLVR